MLSKEADSETCIFGFTIPQTEKKVTIITALRLYDQEECFRCVP